MSVSRSAVFKAGADIDYTIDAVLYGKRPQPNGARHIYIEATGPR
jgi:hypothetical protein